MVASVVTKCCQSKESCQACLRTISVLEPGSTPSKGGHILGQLLRNARGKFQLLPCNRALVMGPLASDTWTVNLNPVNRKLVLHQEMMQKGT